EMINYLNAEKVGDEELVVLGPSMGGLIARYGLAYMEQNSIPHETRLYISFDSPHIGANIPISLQYLINYFAQEIGDATALAIVEDVLFSPAAKEMLSDHLLAHLLAGSTFEQDPTKLLPEGAPGFRDEFQSELDAIGFPQNVRNVTMINGSGNATTTGSPDAVVVDTNLTIDALTDVDVALRFTPAASQTNTVTDLTAYFIGLPVATFTADAESPATSDGTDSSPGGTASISDALGDGGGNPVLEQFIAALEQDLYSFIPTMSALAIDNENLYEVPNLNDSPFVNYYIPNENEDHVTVTGPSAQFALDEIRQGQLSISEINNNQRFIIAPNPVGETIRISTMETLGDRDVQVAIYSLTGQLISDKMMEISSGTIEIEHRLTPGLYTLAIKAGANTTHLKAVVKN
ncbi:MAG: T9SS type A sorting domain-containing protein, partial [Flavobacteriaceae bacterium]|nr:T9SS type A sorting domain-containing protein [Flavobacteriaceae bacterium]